MTPKMAEIRETHNYKILQEELLPLSEASYWEEARPEWVVHRIFMAEETQTCLCSHDPIREICVLRNRKTGALAEVGNVCVNHFLGLSSNKLFAAVKRIQEEPRFKAPNPDLIKIALDRGWVDQWQYDFTLDTWRKQNLSDCQRNVRERINWAIISESIVGAEDPVLAPLRGLWVAANRAGDLWTQRFVHDLARRAKRGAEFSLKQRRLLDRKVSGFGLSLPSWVGEKDKKDL